MHWFEKAVCLIASPKVSHKVKGHDSCCPTLDRKAGAWPEWRARFYEWIAISQKKTVGLPFPQQHNGKTMGQKNPPKPIGLVDWQLSRIAPLREEKRRDFRPSGTISGVDLGEFFGGMQYLDYFSTFLTYPINQNIVFVCDKFTSPNNSPWPAYCWMLLQEKGFLSNFLNKCFCPCWVILLDVFRDFFKGRNCTL